MDNGIDSTVRSLENVFVYSQARFDPLSLCSAALTSGHLKLRADKRKPLERRTVRDQTGRNKGVLIKQIAQGLVKMISRRRWNRYKHIQAIGEFALRRGPTFRLVLRIQYLYKKSKAPNPCMWRSAYNIYGTF